jgi:hypothetical protein
LAIRGRIAEHAQLAARYDKLFALRAAVLDVLEAARHADDYLPALAAGVISPEWRAPLEAHIEKCAQCRANLEKAKAAGAKVAAPKEAPVLIGKSLEARVKLTASGPAKEFLKENLKEMADLFIVSQVEWVDAPGARAKPLTVTAFADAQLTADTPGLVGGQDGDTLPYSPKFSFGANADYEWPVFAGATAFVGGSLRYTGKQRAGFRIDSDSISVDPEGNFIADALPQRRIPDFATIDLRAGVDFGQFTLEAYARNVTGSHGITALNDADGLPAGAIQAAFIQPRTIGLSLSAGF